MKYQTFNFLSNTNLICCILEKSLFKPILLGILTFFMLKFKLLTPYLFCIFLESESLKFPSFKTVLFLPPCIKFLVNITSFLFFSICLKPGLLGLPVNFLGPIIAPVLHAYFDVFAGCIQTLVFVTLSSILIAIEAE